MLFRQAIREAHLRAACKLRPKLCELMINSTDQIVLHQRFVGIIKERLSIPLNGKNEDPKDAVEKEFTNPFHDIIHGVLNKKWFT